MGEGGCAWPVVRRDLKNTWSDRAAFNWMDPQPGDEVVFDFKGQNIPGSIVSRTGERLRFAHANGTESWGTVANVLLLKENNASQDSSPTKLGGVWPPNTSGPTPMSSSTAPKSQTVVSSEVRSPAANCLSLFYCLSCFIVCAVYV